MRKLKPINLIIFTCSTINPSYLFDQKNPERYVSLNPAGNNLEGNIPKLRKLYTKYSKKYQTKITILIGNTDPYYIYSRCWKIYPKLPEQYLWKKFAKRWIKYKKNLAEWLTKKLPNVNFEVTSWYEFEKEVEEKTNYQFKNTYLKVYKNIYNYFPKKLIDWEIESLKLQFGPGKYFFSIKRPPKKLLLDWVKRKFAEYATQGFWIKLFFANSILLQNEKPSLLRSEMYQPLIRKVFNSELPIIYPFGIDNKGFQ